MNIEPAAARGFAAGADDYERGRPSYPSEAVALICRELDVSPGRRVLDLGAGTGKFTRLLVPTGARIVAVEPVPEMLGKLRSFAPDIEALEGTGEAIPLPDVSVDAVVVAQAFHWFDHARALAEIARVLRPGGGLALVWNSRDRSVPWVDRVAEIIRWNKGAIPTYDAGDERWIDVVADRRAFSPVRMATFRNDQDVDADTLIAREASVSYIAAMPETQRAEVLGQIRAVVAGFPERFVLPYLTYVYWCHRLR